jgi:hypothetical protein
MPAVFIQIEENPNCEPVPGLVFQPRTAPVPVAQVLRERNGRETWCDITGLDAGGQPCRAMACLIDDSGEGGCQLVFGGEWGLRLKPESNGRAWDLDDAEQWGEPFLMLAGDGADLQFE